MSRSFNTILLKYKGLGPGFDFLRIGLATTIVLMHSFFDSGNAPAIRATPLWFLEYALVPMFFALSGFLIAGSAQRLSLNNFLINRGLRIIPALAVDICVCALIIGPIVTTVPMATYFSSAEFFRYFLNITGWIHYQLPGVFKSNPNDLVNGALWTVPWEILCYILMSALMVSSLIRSRRGVILTLIGFTAIGLAFQYLQIPDGTILHRIAGAFTSRGSQLIAAFLMGIVVYQNRDVIRYDWRVLAASVALCVAAAVLFDPSAIGQVWNRILLIPALAYITVFLGLTPIWLPEFLKRGDYSYGIYLYHNPFLQLLMLTFPAFANSGPLAAFGLFVCGLVAVSTVAMLSWHLIEKPILAQRKRFSFVAKVRGVEGAPEAKAQPVEAK